jgi:hypothetical protein
VAEHLLSAPRDDTARASCRNEAKSDFLSLVFAKNEVEREEIRPMFRTLKSNSPFSAPRDDTARASCRNEAKSDFLSLKYFWELPKWQSCCPTQEYSPLPRTCGNVGHERYL